MKIFSNYCHSLSFPKSTTEPNQTRSNLIKLLTCTSPTMVKTPPQKLPCLVRRILFSIPRPRLLSPGGTLPTRSLSSVQVMDSSAPASPIRVVSTFSSPLDRPIDASSSIRKPLSLWPGMYHSPVTNALWEARSSIFERLLDSSMDGPPQSELLTKTPAQSRTSIVYNLSTDYILREQYRDPWNEVRIGKLLEDLDALAGTIAVKVCV